MASLSRYVFARIDDLDEDVVISVMGSIAAHLEVFDPGLVRTRRGVRAVCATVLAWATMVAVTSAFDVADPLRITLFAAGASFEGALLAPDPQPRDRVRTLAWAAVVAAVAVVVTVALTQYAVWAAVAVLVLLMFSSYALRSWSPRVASLALMGAITVYITGAGYITRADRLVRPRTGRRLRLARGLGNRDPAR